MRLFPLIDGDFDRYDRGGLLTIPFDLDIITEIVVVPIHIDYAAAFIPGKKASHVYIAGLGYGRAFTTAGPQPAGHK